MELRLTILWLLTGVMGMAQPEFSLKSGEQLSHLNQYGRSTQELEAFIQANPTRLYDQSQALLLISYNHMQLGDYVNALAANEASLNIKGQLHADDLVNNYVRFGAIHLLRGNYHAALSYLLKAKDFPIEAIQLYAIIDGYLAAAYRGLGRFELAETYYRQSIETLLIEYPEDHPNIITSYYHLGKLYAAWEKPEMARQYFQMGLDRSTSASGQAFLQALLHNGLGALYLESAPEKAESYHRKALDIATEYFGGYHRETAQASLYLARAIYRQDRRDEARDAIQLAIRSLNPEQPGLSWTQLPDTARLIIDRPLLAEALGFKARWLMDSALPDEQRLQLALVNSETAAQLLQVAMNKQVDQEDRLQLLDIARAAFAGGIEAGIQMWRERKDNNAQWRAFRLAETAKILQFRAYNGHVLQLSGSFAERERSMLRTLRLAEMNFRLQPLDLTVSRELHRLQENYRSLQEDWRRNEPLGYQQRFGMDRLSLRQTQENLDQEEVVFSYFTGPENTWLFVLDQNGLQTFTLDQTDLASQTAQFSAAIEEGDPLLITAFGHQLYEKLLGPAVSALKRKKLLSIVPDHPFEALPFEALLTKSYQKNRIRFHKIPYLINQLAVRYRHTVTNWEHPPVASPPDYEFLFLSPVFDEEAIARVPANRRVLFDARIHSGTSIAEDNHFRTMEPAPSEASQLQVIWGESDQEGRFKMREAATEQLLRDEMGSAHFIHLATYAFAEGASPEEAGLVLANVTSDKAVQNDGLLLASELLLSVASGTELLSVDQLAAGSGSHQALSLSGSLMLAGVSNFVYTASRHENDAFYPDFYKYLMEGTAIAESLKMVKQRYAKQKETAHPAHWAHYRLWSR